MRRACRTGWSLNIDVRWHDARTQNKRHWHVWSSDEICHGIAAHSHNGSHVINARTALDKHNAMTDLTGKPVAQLESDDTNRTTAPFVPTERSPQRSSEAEEATKSLQKPFKDSEDCSGHGGTAMSQTTCRSTLCQTKNCNIKF